MELFDLIRKKEEKKHTLKHYARRILFSGVWITALLILIEFLMLIALFYRFAEYSGFIFEAMVIGGVVVMIYIINEKSNPAYKIAWIIPIMLFPLVGCMLYLFVKFNFGNLAAKGMLQKNIRETERFSNTKEDVKANIEAEEVAELYGINATNAVNYHADTIGSGVVYESLNEVVGNFRVNKKLKSNWKDNIKKDYESRK